MVPEQACWSNGVRGQRATQTAGGAAADGMLTLRRTCLSDVSPETLTRYIGGGGDGISAGIRGRRSAVTGTSASRGENMNTRLQRRPVLLAGLLLLTLTALATGIQVAQATTATGSGLGSSATSFATTASLQGLTVAAQNAHHQGAAAAASFATTASLQGLTVAAQNAHHQGAAVSAPRVAAAAGTLGRGGVDSASLTPATGAQPASSASSSTAGTSSRTAWIAAGAIAAALIIVAAWVLARRRRRPDELAPATSSAAANKSFCAQHPEDSLCRTG